MPDQPRTPAGPEPPLWTLPATELRELAAALADIGMPVTADVRAELISGIAAGI